MSNNYDDYDYEDEESTGLGKKILIFFLIIIAIIIVIFLLKSCSKKEVEKPKKQEETFNYEEALIQAGKEYYDTLNDDYPTEIGECKSVDLQHLLEKNLIDKEKFGECNVNNTYLRVCVLENGTKQYTPWLTCKDINSETEYDTLEKGQLSDVIQNSTYVEFKFLPQYLKTEGQSLGKVEEMWKDDIKYQAYKTLSTTTYYRYRDKLFNWNVEAKYYYNRNGKETTNPNSINEYYTTSPNSNYEKYDNKTTEAYKWYTTSSKQYALNSTGEKAFSPTPIGEYNVRDDNSGIKVVMYCKRSVVSTYDPVIYYQCSESKNSSIKVNQRNKKCGEGANKNLTYTVKSYYSCASSDSSTPESMKVEKGTKCNTYSECTLSQTSCGTINGTTCTSATQNFYNWYKEDKNSVRSYYPSGASKASGEKTYYTQAPVAGAVKDTNERATAYKWYRSVRSTTSEYTAVAPSGYVNATRSNNSKYSDWSSWSTNNPKVSDGRIREIETKKKIKLQQILNTQTSTAWANLSNDYLTEDEMLKLFTDKKYSVANLEDINDNSEIKYNLQMYVRNKKENK